jgi:hypothetical protein
MIEYVLKSKSKVTAAEEAQLNWLRYKDGFIWPEYLNEYNSGTVIIAKDGKSIVAWGLIFLDNSNNRLTLFLYTRKSHRRMGLGTEIYNRAVKQFGNKLRISKHNIPASKFFNSVGA